MISVLKQMGFRPRTAVWELTLACNLRCRHCGSRAGRPRSDELPTPRALELCRELADLGCRQVTLGGGEPTLRKEWPVIASALVERGIKVNMTTNGLKWTPTLAKQIKTFGLESICFSVDGLAGTHEYIRRVKGHFRKIFAAIDMCHDMGIACSIITSVTRRVIPELEPLRDMLTEHHVRSWQIQLGNPTGYMEENPDLVISPEDVLEIVPLVARLRQESKRPRIYVGDNIGYYGGLEEYLRHKKAMVPFWIGCHAGCQVIGIESNGNIKGCQSLPSAMNNVDAFVEGNILEHPLKAIWNDPKAFQYNREFKLDDLAGFCRSCENAEICRGGCSWTAFAHTRSRYDNPYCYHRQIHEKAEAEGKDPKELAESLKAAAGLR